MRDQIDFAHQIAARSHSRCHGHKLRFALTLIVEVLSRLRRIHESCAGNRQLLKGVTFLAGACLCFGTSGTAQALGPDNSSPLVVGAARLLLGAIGLFALIKFREPKNLPRKLLWLGAFAVGSFQLCFFLEFGSQVLLWELLLHWEVPLQSPRS